MTEEYQSPLPSIDRSIAEIPDGRSRSKIIATVVDYTHPTLILNDGSDQLQVTIPGFIHLEFEDLKVGSMGRFLVDIEKTDDGVIKRILAYHPMDKDQINKYHQLVKIEKNQAK